MNFFRLRLITIMILSCGPVICQQTGPEFRGFLRAGAYPGINEIKNKPEISTAFTDIGFLTDYENGTVLIAHAEMQFRYGAEFGTTVRDFKMREAYATVYGKKWNLSAGQKIIRWGRSDFVNPTSKLTPRDLLLRSPDREEINLGNILAEINFHPTDRIRLQTIAVPMYRSSVLVIDPIPLPSYVNVNLINSFITDDAFSYGLRADFYLRSIDLGISWFDGYDPMPGIRLTSFEIRNSGGFPLPVIDLEAKPYRNRMAGIDFETNAGSFGFRGEAAWTIPRLSFEQHEFVPLPSVELAAGGDWSGGSWRVSAEYYGKYIYDFLPPEGESLIGTEPDMAMLSQMMAVPGFDMKEYVRAQVAAFNRLFNYQVEQFYHSIGVRIESDFSYGKIVPSIFTLYNFTSGEVLIMPEIRYKPADNLTIVLGSEYYKGKKGSLYRITDSFMNCIYVSLRTDF